ncbi:MAG: hypothetical protein ABIP44_00610 [Pseudoxanthomonas sp.]
MSKEILSLGSCRFEVIETDGHFTGLGRIWIGEHLVRSGRLPMSVATQTFSGLELKRLRLLDKKVQPKEIRIVMQAEFEPMSVKLMKDHSLDPIHELEDWEAPRIAGEGKLTLVLKPADEAIFERFLSGFSYHYEYESKKTPLFYLMDRGSWELDGNVEGATVVSQSACSAPVAKFEAETNWTTEGVIFFGDAASKANPVMTHNLPRWASHQAFDYQYKGDATLVGLFERVGLVRSVILRQPGKAELKTFDKHIFDQGLRVSTVPKKILLNEEKKSEVDQQNLWTWIIQEVHDRARGEFGLKEEDFHPRISWNYWNNFTVDTYRKDLLPAAKAFGVRALFVDNLNKSAMSEKCPNPPHVQWNMCTGHEYEIAPTLGGEEKVKQFIDDCRAANVQVYSWTNNCQGLASPINAAERDERGWFNKMEDSRTKYGGAYTNIFSALDFKKEESRRYWVDSLIKIKEATGLNGWLFDSFYNLGFMPVNYANMQPTTMWKETLQAFKELQDNDIHFLIESFGPFGIVQHGCPSTYNLKVIFACYKIGLGNDYTTIPSGETIAIWPGEDADNLYRAYAHTTDAGIALTWQGKSIHEMWGDAQRRTLADYYDCYPDMYRRFIEEGDRGVLYHDRTGKKAILWNFTARTVSLPGSVFDVTANQALSHEKSYQLEPSHTYRIEADELPCKIS